MFQGDEIGMPDGPGHDPPLDRTGRDAYRHPMQWDPSPGGGFTTGTPWLPPTDPPERNVATQSQDPRSTLSLYRQLIDLRKHLRGEPRLLDSPPNTIVVQRGNHEIAANFAAAPAPIKRTGISFIQARPGDDADPEV